MGLLSCRDTAAWTIICALLVLPVQASHFAGGMFTWAPTGNGRETRVDFSLSWYSRNDCDATTVTLTCFYGCPLTTVPSDSLTVNCTDYNEAGKWSSGRNSLTLTPPENVTQFSFGYRDVGWIDVVRGGSWSLKTFADVSIRSDTNRINSSPTVEMSPEVRLQHGCQHKIVLPVHDADGDFIRCRFAKSENMECGGVCDAFNATLSQTECTLKYIADGNMSWYAVAIQIEDFLSASSTTPLSSVPLQFLVNVFTSTDSCGSVPVFVLPTPEAETCFPISANDNFAFTVVAFTNSSASIKRVDTVKNGTNTSSYAFSNSSGSYMRLDVNWIPGLKDAGNHTFCFSAVDNNDQRSEQRCVHLYVEAKPNLVDVKKMENGSFINFVLIYDKVLERPDTSTYIRIFGDNDAVYISLNAKSDNVTFGGYSISFGLWVNLAKSYYILLDKGVVLGICNQPADAIVNKTRIVIEKKDCRMPVDVTFANFTHTGTTYGESVTYTCNDGYFTRSGNDVRYCEANALWNGSIPTCTEKFHAGNECLADVTEVSQCLTEDTFCRFDPSKGTFRCLCSLDQFLSLQGEAKCLNKSEYDGRCHTKEQCTTFLSECIQTDMDPGRCICPWRAYYNETADECTSNTIMFCPASNDRFGLLWNRTQIETTAYQPCPSGSSGQIIRKCHADGIFSNALYNCTSEAFRNLADEVQSNNILTSYALGSLQKALSVIQSDNGSAEILAGDVERIEYILSYLVEKEVNDTAAAPQLTRNDTETFFDIFSQLIDPVIRGPQFENGLDQTSKGAAKLVETIDRFSLNYAKISESNNETTTIIKNNLVLSAFKVDSDLDGAIQYPMDDVNHTLTFNRTSSFNLNRKSLSENVTAIVVVVYRDLSKALPKTSIQQGSQTTGRTINSQVLSIQLLPEAPKVLNPPIQLTFSIDKLEEGFESLCSFWTSSKNGTQGGWSTSGCKRTMANTTTVQCSCSHLTNFAILTSPKETPVQHQSALTVISLAGCGVSIVCLVMTLIIHFFYWRFLKGDRNVLAITLCGSLLVAYLLFVFGVTRTNVKSVCTTIAVLLHYNFLLVFFLLLSEGIYMVFQVVFPFHKKSHLKLFLIGSFVLPAVFIGISASATQLDGYGNDKYCWLIVNSMAFWMFVGPVLFVVVVNLTIIILIMRKMYGTKWIKNMSKREKAKTLVSKTLALLPVMGVTWLFGILSVHDSAIWLKYLFVIFNSFQGLFIFIFHCVMNRQLRAVITKSQKPAPTFSEETSRSRGGPEQSTSQTSFTEVEQPSVCKNDDNTDHAIAEDVASDFSIEEDPAAAVSEEEMREFKKRYAIPSQALMEDAKARRPPTKVFLDLQKELRERLQSIVHAMTAQDTTILTKNCKKQSFQEPLDCDVVAINNGEDGDTAVNGGFEPEEDISFTLDNKCYTENGGKGKEQYEDVEKECMAGGEDHKKCEEGAE